MAYLTLDLGRGMARDFILQTRDAVTGEAYGPTPPAVPSPFNGSESLVGSLWRGDETSTVVTPSVSWSDVTIGTTLTSFVNSDTANLSLGTYRYQITATRGGRTFPVVECNLRLSATPGTQTIPMAFTVLDDLLRYAPWIEDLQAERQVTGFMEEQYRATEDLIQILVRLWKNSSGMSPTLGQSGWNAASLGYANDLPSKWLRDQITPAPVDGQHPANSGNPGIYSALIVRELTKEYCAKMAISYICAAQMGRTSERNFQGLASYFRRDADSLLKTYTAEIDLSIPQTGWASITVNCGGGSLR
jgi:hypothetical protein